MIGLGRALSLLAMNEAVFCTFSLSNLSSSDTCTRNDMHVYTIYHCRAENNKGNITKSYPRTILLCWLPLEDKQSNLFSAQYRLPSGYSTSNRRFSSLDAYCLMDFTPFTLDRTCTRYTYILRIGMHTYTLILS